MYNTTEELKDLIAATLDIDEVLDLLDLSLRELLDYLDDIISDEETSEKLVRACR